MNKVTTRNMKVDYFEKEGETWVVDAHLSDEEHDIAIVIEIDMAQMLVTDAKIHFNRFPLNHCTLIEDKASQLIGLKVDQEFVRNAMRIFMGPHGCPNIMTLLNISIPGIIYFYYPYKIKSGEIKPEQWDNVIRTELKDACLAHTLL
jgi:Protein of unknown function (DUF2889).